MAIGAALGLYLVVLGALMGAAMERMTLETLQ